jgi:hypothetical protein
VSPRAAHEAAAALPCHGHRQWHEQFVRSLAKYRQPPELSAPCEMIKTGVSSTPSTHRATSAAV